MRNFLRIATNIDVMPLMHAIARRPDLWDAHRWRTTYQNTPHAAVNDIWLRYADPDKTADPNATNPVIADLQPVFYPAWEALPQVRPIVFDLMRRVEAIELGRVLITKLRPGGRILRHADADGAYVDAGSRYHVALQGLPGSLYMAGDETVCMRTGECWWFDHKAVHEVANNSTDDRVHLLVDFRL
jgi:hypothetical protein